MKGYLSNDDNFTDDGRSEKMLQDIYENCLPCVCTFGHDGRVIIHQMKTPLIDGEHIIKESGLHKTQDQTPLI